MTDHQMYIKCCAFIFFFDIPEGHSNCPDTSPDPKHKPTSSNNTKRTQFNQCFFFKDLFINIKNIWFDSIYVFFLVICKVHILW